MPKINGTDEKNLVKSGLEPAFLFCENYISNINSYQLNFSNTKKNLIVPINIYFLSFKI